MLCPECGMMDAEVVVSCITVIGRRYSVPEGCEEPLRYTGPEWTTSKAKRLYDMAVSTNPKKRAVAAAHPRTRPGVLWGLLTDEDVIVRTAAVKNPKLDARMRSLAAQDEDAGIRAYAKFLAGDFSS